MVYFQFWNEGLKPGKSVMYRVDKSSSRFFHNMVNPLVPVQRLGEKYHSSKQSDRSYSPYLKEDQNLVVFRPSADWMGLTHLRESILLYSAYQLKC